MKEEQLKQHFEALFGISYDAGREDVRHLIERAQQMGRFAEGAKINWSGKTTLNDQDFLKVAFFAIIGAGFAEDILGTPELPAKTERADIAPKSTRCGRCQKTIGPTDGRYNTSPPICEECGVKQSSEGERAGVFSPANHKDDGDDLGIVDGPEMFPEEDGVSSKDPRTYDVEPYRNLEVRHSHPDILPDVMTANDPRRPEKLMRCANCLRDLVHDGDGWICVNPGCINHHQAVEIDFG